ncbi:MAG: DUF6323 family protein [Clostridiaceae bacterium]
MKDFLISIPDSMIVKQIIIEIQKINEQTIEYGLKLSEKDIKTILKTRSEALSSNGRVEFGGGIITQIISSFCDSPYISQYNYVETISDLIETFYYYKNETMEDISDDELIGFMKLCFDNKCQGDMEFLRGRYLDKLAHNVKYGEADYLEMDEYIECNNYSDEIGDEE